MKFTDFFEQRILTDDEGKQALAKLLRIILTVSLILLPISIGLRYFDDFTLSVVDLTISLLFLSFLVSLYMLNRGEFFISSLFFIISGWIAMTVLAGRSSGIKDISIIGYILLIYVATMLTGSRFAIILTVMSVISIWVMAIMQYEGFLVPDKDAPLQYARDFTIFFFMVLTAIILFERTIQYSYQRLQRELKERVLTEEMLRINEKKLIEQNKDLSDAKLRAEESDRLKTAFIQNISHEIRSPMNGIVELAELMRSKDINPAERSGYIRKMLIFSEQLTGLIDNLIEISKLEIGAVEVVYSEFMADELLKDIEKIFVVKVKEKGIRLEIENGLKGIYIRSDLSKLKQIIYNLAENAIKFTDNGMVRIEAGFTSGDLIVAVKDTGRGISKENLPYIFDHFRQTTNGMESPSGETGLGLSICKGHLKLLGGDISVESEPGRGSNFTFWLPVEITSSLKNIDGK